MAFNTLHFSLEDIEPLAAQVAGHVFADGKRSGGMLKHKDGYVLKLPKKTQQAKNELEFYRSFPSSHYTDLQHFIPKCYGTARININGFCEDVLVLEDLVAKLGKPCVMDIKIGKQTWDPFATAEKIENESKKYKECKTALSFCIPGFQVYNIQSDDPIKFGKEYGRGLNKETLPNAFLTFLNFQLSESNAKKITQYYVSELEKIHSILSSLSGLHLYSSSILLTYDFNKFHSSQDVSSWASVHMIDFAHAYLNSSLSKEKDQNYLEGLASLISVLRKLELY